MTVMAAHHVGRSWCPLLITLRVGVNMQLLPVCAFLTFYLHAAVPCCFVIKAGVNSCFPDFALL